MGLIDLSGEDWDEEDEEEEDWDEDDWEVREAQFIGWVFMDFTMQYALAGYFYGYYRHSLDV